MMEERGSTEKTGGVSCPDPMDRIKKTNKYGIHAGRVFVASHRRDLRSKTAGLAAISVHRLRIGDGGEF
jgi:hypothetical protein